ncbi:MAG: terminase family protein [Puniceicoccales bacterium]|jgi:phage FluMu gp28-like protein|nr:terminase family protein [Puniceicoccales bacterium]
MLRHSQTFFLPYQKRWIMDNARIKIMEKSRQIGLSWASAYRAVRESLRYPQRSIWICSRDLTQAKLFLDDCKKFANVLHPIMRQPVLDSKRKQCIYALHFNNGSTLQIVSSNPNAQAGKRGTRILDEFALHENPEHLYNIAYPGITWGGHLEIISTHRGANNFFNKLLQDIKFNGNPKNISLHTITLADALEQGFLQKLKLKLPKEDLRQTMDESAYFNFIRNACVHENVFRQEYMCTPMDDDASFIKFVDLEPCLYTPSESWETVPRYPTFLGVDLARSNDLSVFVIIETLGDTCFTRKICTLKNAHFDQQEILLDYLLKDYPIQHACIDQTGIGYQFVERAQKRWGTHRIKGIHFSQKIKEKLAYGLKMIIERHQLKIPNDPALINDFLNIHLQWTSSQAHFVANHTADGHADRFWAFALALSAAEHMQATPCNTEIFQTHKHFIYEN